MSHVSVFAPASVAIISCGLTFCVCLYNVGDTIHVQETSKPGIEITKISGKIYHQKNVAGVAGSVFEDFG